MNSTVIIRYRLQRIICYCVAKESSTIAQNEVYIKILMRPLVVGRTEAATVCRMRNVPRFRKSAVMNKKTKTKILT